VQGEQPCKAAENLTNLTHRTTIRPPV
jgi:hypothetical protein